MNQKTNPMKNVLSVVYYLGVYGVLVLYNLLIEWLKDGAAKSFDMTLTAYLLPLGGILLGGYLLLDRLVKPDLIFRIVCKTLLILFLFFGCTFFWTANFLFYTWVAEVDIALPMVCGYYLFSLICDVRSFIKEKKINESKNHPITENRKSR